MILYRITSKEHTHDLSGTGAMLFGGRWNSKGVRILYTSSSLSLAALEVIANLSGDKINKNLYCVEIEFPDHLPIEIVDPLPEKWNEFPYNATTVEAGNDFIQRGGLCLKAPSAIIPTEYNYLLNPIHEDFVKIKLLDSRPMILDKRLFLS